MFPYDQTEFTHWLIQFCLPVTSSAAEDPKSLAEFALNLRDTSQEEPSVNQRDASQEAPTVNLRNASQGNASPGLVLSEVSVEAQVFGQVGARLYREMLISCESLHCWLTNIPCTLFLDLD